MSVSPRTQRRSQFPVALIRRHLFVNSANTQLFCSYQLEILSSTGSFCPTTNVRSLQTLNGQQQRRLHVDCSSSPIVPPLLGARHFSRFIFS